MIKRCPEIAKFRYTWPGSIEIYVCEDHMNQFKHISEAMGFFMQFIPLEGTDLEGLQCSQNTEAKDD